jgi:DeoR/GlpR family transcriptional regulator of sugar metabolism
MTATERREAIIEALNIRREDKICNLANEFEVTERTIRTDIAVLTCAGHALVTKRGRYGGGVMLEPWYHLHRQSFSPQERNLLKRLARNLKGDDLRVMNGLCSKFAH